MSEKSSLSNQSVIPFCYESTEIRTYIDEAGNPWFVAKDVCDVLNIANPTQAVQQLDEDEYSMQNIGYSGPGNPNVNVINESGLYTLIIRSNKPDAKKFRKWVTSEVLPQIRRTGQYSVATQTDKLDLIELSDSIQSIQKQIIELNHISSRNLILLNEQRSVMDNILRDMLSAKQNDGKDLPLRAVKIPGGLIRVFLIDGQPMVYARDFFHAGGYLPDIKNYSTPGKLQQLGFAKGMDFTVLKSAKLGDQYAASPNYIFIKAGINEHAMSITVITQQGLKHAFKLNDKFREYYQAHIVHKIPELYSVLASL